MWSVVPIGQTTTLAEEGTTATLMASDSHSNDEVLVDVCLTSYLTKLFILFQARVNNPALSERTLRKKIQDSKFTANTAIQVTYIDRYDEL